MVIGLPFDRQGNERKQFVRISLDGTYCIMTPAEGEQFLREAEYPDDYTVADVWMSQAEFDAMPEFAGF